VARYYFHLANRRDFIRDEDGLELADLAQARTEALKAIEELRQENPVAAMDWAG
jgi:hypothetical protein